MEEKQPCGHPLSAIVSDEDGTCYCGGCYADEGMIMMEKTKIFLEHFVCSAVMAFFLAFFLGSIASFFIPSYLFKAAVWAGAGAAIGCGTWNGLYAVRVRDKIKL